MFVTTAAAKALFETDFIVLPYFYLCHVAAKNLYWDRANVGVRGVAPGRRKHRGSEKRIPCIGQFLQFLIKMT